MTSESETKEKKQNPIVPYLRLPARAGEKAYLAGSKCRACGAAYVGKRLACAKCFAVDNFEEIRLGEYGTLRTFSIVYQSIPGIEVPFIAAVVDLPEGTAVRANLGGIEPDPDKIVPLLGKKLEMYTEKVREDKEGNDVIAYRYRPAGA
ncbi:MAG TPA: OB-fold domain-containing protein [Dehalococcoidia bacterium]|nr:OB-fold domain-containing protein [Dehalococcoidia bacterium]